MSIQMQRLQASQRMDVSELRRVSQTRSVRPASGFQSKTFACSLVGSQVIVAAGVVRVKGVGNYPVSQQTIETKGWLG